MNEHEHHRQYVLTMIETAQRAGRAEEEIVAIVERYFNTDLAERRAEARRGRLLGRFRGGLRRAA